MVDSPHSTRTGMSATTRLSITAAVAIGTLALVQTTGGRSREAAAVRATRIAQNTAIAQHDLDRAASYWTDDVVIRSALGRVIQGRGDYRTVLGADSATLYRRDTDRVDVS